MLAASKPAVGRTYNPHHAYPVGDRFLLLKRGRSIGYYSKKDVTLEQLTTQLAGGAELVELASQLEELGGHNDVVAEVAAEVAGSEATRG